MSSAIKNYLKYAHVQMAAEAFLIERDTGEKLFFAGDKLKKALESTSKNL